MFGHINSTPVLVLSTLVGIVFACEQSCKPESCLDIYKEDKRNPSGDYVIYQQNQAIRVYCSFEGDYGLTYISRKFPGSDIHLESLFSMKEFAKIRILKSNGVQSEVTVENLLLYQNSSTLSFGYNNHDNYQLSSLTTKKLHPYLFLGFLPISLAKNRNTQGYRAAGRDFPFKNCDSNPNSYITFFLNPKIEKQAKKGTPNSVMTGWITTSSPLQYPEYMDESLFMEWEMHMGGCGGLITTQDVSGTKAALGLPFAISESIEDMEKICAEGLAMNPPQFYFPSINPKYIIECDSHGGRLLRICDSERK